MADLPEGSNAALEALRDLYRALHAPSPATVLHAFGAVSHGWGNFSSDGWVGLTPGGVER
ncbi:hypothetical protein T484DRAFT_1825124 [Baffinella frigidus]|nr:hypothetical protein T484DRAFT_1825124 [Cryptophyta sp. CCMP2293]